MDQDRKRSSTIHILKEKFLLKNILVEHEKRINIYSVDSGKVVGLYQPDFIIEQKVILEIKSSMNSSTLDEKQLYFYLRNSCYELGYLINFSTPQLLIKRIVYSNNRKPFLRLA
jgi:GxxExxY protein